MNQYNPFKYFKTSPEIIRLAVMYYVRYPLSYRQVDDILHERGIDICHEMIRYWVERFGLKVAGEIRRRNGSHVRLGFDLPDDVELVREELFEDADKFTMP